MIYYKYQNISFVSPKDNGNIIVFTNLKDSSLFPKVSNKKIAVLTSDVNTLEFWLNKKIDFIINPFDFKGRAFDSKTFSVMKQKNILPIIILDFIIEKDTKKQIYLLKHLLLFNKLCKKNKIPLIILANDEKQSKEMYITLGYNEKQIKNFLSDFYEK